MPLTLMSAVSEEAHVGDDVVQMWNSWLGHGTPDGIMQCLSDIKAEFSLDRNATLIRLEALSIMLERQMDFCDYLRREIERRPFKCLVEETEAYDLTYRRLSALQETLAREIAAEKLLLQRDVLEIEDAKDAEYELTADASPPPEVSDEQRVQEEIAHVGEEVYRAL
jgi:hypothetical protein